MKAHWMDFLKYGGSTPSFDVVSRTKEFAGANTYEEAGKFYADDYIFRGSIVGPITAKDVELTQKGFNVPEAFPDLVRDSFGFHVDPENPFRCLYFERWKGTHTGELRVGPLKIPATGKQVDVPMHVMSVTWNPEGKIAYVSVSPPVDRFEGNTQGKGAVFGLLSGAGLDSGMAAVGNPFTILGQQAFQALGQKTWSEDDELPRWWKSKAKGAEANDM